MGLFEKPWSQIRAWLDDQQTSPHVRDLVAADYENWPQKSTMVLAEDTAVELGNPGIGSLSLVMWAPVNNEVMDDQISILGPDVPEMTEAAAPFAQLLIVGGEIEDEYECYRDLKEVIYQTRLSGFMVRALPSRQHIWCRVSREAKEKGFSLAHWGAALSHNAKRLDFVTRAQVIFVTGDKDWLQPLMQPALEVGRIAGALVKMKEEMNFDCESCEFWDVCETVAELKIIRRKLLEGKQT